MSRIQKIIHKYLSNTATLSEIEELEEWVRSSAENADFFKNYVREHERGIKTKKQFNKEQAYKEFLQLKKTEKEVGAYLKWIAIASITIVFAGQYWLHKITSKNHEVIEITELDDRILLTLEDGTKKALKENEASFIVGAMGDTLQQKENNSLVYNSKSSSISKVRYHLLEIPLGKTFELELSDGSRVWLNAGSSLRFPVNFHKNRENREVELKGEAFFEIAENKNQPFIVKTSKVAIKVLGTRFNVSSYEEDQTIKTTLVEGSVNIYTLKNKSNEVTLDPKDQTVFNKFSGRMETYQVNVDKYISWIHKKLYFENDPFHEIIKQIERSYNVKITNHNKSLDNIRFTGEFDIEDVNNVLETFKANTPFSYSISNNKIIIYK